MPLFERDLEAIKTTTEETIDFGGHSLTDKDVEIIVPLLNQNPNITKVIMSKSSIGNKGAAQLATLQYVEELDLSENNVGDEGVKALATSGIKRLFLACNNLTDEGGRYLVQHATQTVLTVDRNNELSSEVIQAIEARIAENAARKGSTNNCRMGGQVIHA